MNPAPSINHLREAVAIGSPTAQKLLSQIDLEVKQAKEAKAAQEQAATEQARTERGLRCDAIQARIDVALKEYDQHRVQAEQALLVAFAASRELPGGVEPRPPFRHLRKVHLPPAFLGPMDPLYPAFASVEVALMTVEK
jgi:hypothetical protein